MRRERTLHALSDAELLGQLTTTLARSRRSEAKLVAEIAEVDRRRLYAHEACPSMFAYCTGVLHLSEPAAYLRIAAARASRDYPELLEMLGDGRLHLSGIVKLAPHLTRENCDDLLARATHRSKREIEELVAELAPKPDVPPVIRKLPAPRPSVASPTRPVTPPPTVAHLRPPPAPSPRPEPLAPERYKVQFTASAELRDKLERLTALMHTSTAPADLSEVIEAAVTEKLERLEARRFGASRSPRKVVRAAKTTPDARYIPAPVRREVHVRDGGRCTFVSPKRKRCDERNRLEFHHEVPFGRGGSHAPENLRLMCPAHNRLFAELDYGRELVER